MRPAWSESDARPSWAESETRPNWDLPGERPQWAEREERPQWSDPEERPQWTDPLRQQERPQWPEQQEWRPAEREIPQPHAPEPQPQPQPERPHQQDQPRPRRRPAPIPVFTAPPRPPVTGRPTAESLDPESLLRGRRNAPSKGWRRLIYKASGGWIKPGEPPEVRRRRELVTRARTPVTAGHHRVAVLSLKGGVGKTTTTVGLGATLAQMRGDRVIAVDANPDRGTLSDKLVLETSATVRDLLNEREQVKRYVDIRAFTSQAASRLEILASDRDPSVSEAFSGGDYQAVSQVLENFYSICLTDCGTGLLHSAMGGVLGLADQIVLVSSPSVDGARAASATLDWLEAHHYGDLVKAATVVLCSVRPRSKSAVDIKKLEAHFAARCRAVIRVPYDPHLEEGAEIDLDRLQESTRDAYLQLAACVGDGFAGIRE
ncbi:MinD/ParA family protein [Nonomuraea zeae]|uniref:MinD/ParA family protein n=1 Tax=Nonomuraea zeae TaxID=1642303 RepID=A0A5S4GCN2_9ACTN|nr:MinD/ParA family protein [Nonomuraea zeae]